SRQTRDEAHTDRVPHSCEHDRDDRRRLLCRHYGWGFPRDDDVDFEPGKLGRDLGQAIAAPVCPAIFDRDRAALDPTEVVEPPRECGRPLTFRQRCAVAQEPDNWSLPRLLRTRRKRPRCRAAEQRDKGAPLHCLMPPVLSIERIAHIGTAGDRCAAACGASTPTSLR